MPLRIFLSYAWNDNVRPPNDPDAKGFVTALYAQLQYELTLLGPPKPEIWWDIDNVKDGDLFDPKIKDAIGKSALFVAVLSRNWTSREYCLNELEMFRQRWVVEAESDFKVEHRIIVVRKDLVDDARCPLLLRGQRGYTFFKFNGPEEAGSETLFYDRGKIVDDGYTAAIRGLAGYLWRKANFMANKVEPDAIEPPPPVINVPAVKPAPRNGRTIYLAKPGADLEQAYQRIAKELFQQGFDIRPRKDESIPRDDSRTRSIDDAMAASELSVHLLGENSGDGGEPLVKLQLERAGKRVTDTATNDKGRFRRIVWAPKVLDEKAGNDGASPGEKLVERNPVEELQAIDSFLSSDKVDGGTVSDFVTFLLQNLGTRGGEDTPTDDSPDSSDCYVYHDSRDLAFARGIAKALRKRNIETILTATQGSDVERLALHRQNLKDCDSVVLCWGDASEVWAQASSRELKNWKQLGRTKKFKVRGLLVGPPPGEVKVDVDELWPKSEIDVVIPVTSEESPSPEILDPLGLGATAK